LIVKNWIILGVAVSAILAYTVGIPPSFAEYSKSAQYTSSANSCGNTEADGDTTTNTLASAYQSSDYETLVDNTATYCANTDSQIQGEENSVGLSSSQR
jgi:hypothetical protein